MATLMKVVGFAGGHPCPIAGQYLESFDHEAHDGLGFGTFVLNPTHAMRFKDLVEAAEFWKTVPLCRPMRPDGQPNRPLTATTVTFEEVK